MATGDMARTQDTDSQETGGVGANGRSSSAAPAQPSVPPLAIAGVVVSKVGLISALRIYVAQLTDISELDGNRFLLSVVKQG